MLLFFLNGNDLFLGWTARGGKQGYFQGFEEPRIFRFQEKYAIELTDEL